MQGDTPQPSAWEMLRSAFAENGGTDGQFAAVMDEIEAERKRDVERRFDGLDLKLVNPFEAGA